MTIMDNESVPYEILGASSFPYLPTDHDIVAPPGGQVGNWLLSYLFSEFNEWVNPSNAEATFIQSKDFWKPSKPCHVGIHWKDLTTHVPGFSYLSGFLHNFALAKLATSSIKVNTFMPVAPKNR